MSLPDMTADNLTKDSNSFGVEFAEHILSEWSYGVRGEERKKIALVDSHMEGTVDVSHLKKLFSSGGDLSAINVSWSYSSELPRFITSVVEGFSYDKYRARVKGVDMMTQDKRSKFKREKLKAMATREEAAQVSEIMGMDFTHHGELPDSIDELNLYMELSFKTAQEIAMQIGVQKIFDINDWQEVFNNVAGDLAKHGRGIVSVKKHNAHGVEFGYVHPIDFVYSRDTKKTRDARGRYYYGHVRTMTIAEIEQESNGQLSQEQIKNLAGIVNSRATSFDDFNDEDLSASVEVLDFCFKANRYRIKKKKYNKHGGYKYIDKDDYWNPPKNNNFDVLKTPYEVWYEGTYIIGSGILLNYGLMDGIMRDPRNNRKAIPPYIMYNTETEPLGQRIIDLSDDIYIVLVKLRQFVIKMKPKGYAIDVDGLQSLDLPDGTVLSPLEQIRIFNQDGNLLFSGQSLLGEDMKSRPPIHDLPDATGNELAELINTYKVLTARLHDITGVNAQSTGAAPPARTSKDVYQGTVGAAQRSVNNIFNGLLSIQQRSSECIISRLQSAAANGETYDIIKSILGEYTTDLLREMANVHKYMFIVNVDVSPTDEDRAALSQDLSLALNSGTITVDDKIDIQEIDDLRLARQMIKIRQKKNLKRKQQELDLQAKREQQIAAAKEQEKRNTMQFEAQLKSQTTSAEKQIEAKLLAFKSDAKMKEISLTKQWDMAIAKEEAAIKAGIDSSKEDRKDNRVVLQGEVTKGNKPQTNGTQKNPVQPAQ